MADLIFEIGTEELPASFIGPAKAELKEAFQRAASALRLTSESGVTYGTPRRLALLVKGLPEASADESSVLVGPPENAPQQARDGFAKKVGVSPDQLQVKDGRWVGTQSRPGQKVLALLPELLAKLIPEIAKNKKSMRWCEEDVSFPRPIRWICAVFGGEVVPVKFGDVMASGVTYGHRFLAPGAIQIRTCDEYLPKLLAAKVIARTEDRRARVVEEIDRVAKEAGGRRVPDDDLVDTITGLVEWPSGVLGSFGADALDMPREVLVSEMRGHQKYASIESADGKLMPVFCAVANTPVRDVAVSRRGYERVLRARLSDARYFFDEDRTRELGDRVAELRRVTFQAQLGSIHDKLERFTHFAKQIASRLPGVDAAKVERTAYLSKADLTTGMVGEFPELQGVMGREYARAAGEPADVAVGIFEHYLPRGASESLPKDLGDLGAVVGIADRLDTIAGIFAIGKAPAGANDPFALRRACLGIIRVILHKNYRLHLAKMIDFSLDHHYERLSKLPAPPEKKGEKKKDAILDRAEARTQIIDFFRARLKALWTEENPADLVEAVLVAGFDDLRDAKARLDALAEIKASPDFIPLAMAFGRASNIIEKQAKDLVAGEVDRALFCEEPEGKLYEASQSARKVAMAAVEKGDYRAALRMLAELRPAVDAFFDKVLVMAEDSALRTNRLRLVQGVQQLFAPIADFGRIQTK